jgi:hypothetical protein
MFALIRSIRRLLHDRTFVHTMRRVAHTCGDCDQHAVRSRRTVITGTPVGSLGGGHWSVRDRRKRNRRRLETWVASVVASSLVEDHQLEPGEKVWVASRSIAVILSRVIVKPEDDARPSGHRPQVRPVGFEPLREPLTFVHPVTLPRRAST